MDQGDHQLPWPALDFDDNELWLDNVWGDSMFNQMLNPPLPPQIDQSHPLTPGTEDDWMSLQNLTSGCPFNHKAPAISDPNEAQESLLGWDFQGQANSSYIANFLVVPDEGQDNSYGTHPQISSYGISQYQLGAQTTEVGPACMAFRAPSSLSSGVPPTSLDLELNAAPVTTKEASTPSVRKKPHGTLASSSRRQRKSSKPPKPRLPCTHADCKLTFPRPYELQRHQNNFHERVIIPCIVYGCNRIGKPVARVDKFREHMRKHENAYAFVCAIEDCPGGPFDRDQLCQHLNDKHDLDLCRQDRIVKERLHALSLRIKQLNDRWTLVENPGTCPLSFLGCGFRVPYLYAPFGASPSSGHIRTHDIVERSKGYDALIENGYDDYDSGRGKATCPICQKLVCKKNDYLSDFIHHVNEHSKEERKPYIAGLWECIRPFTYYNNSSNYRKIQNEYREATGLPPLWKYL
ncbi:hypothetical protein EG329_005952 [Mollisiaceae sp. DMI_Dod_QoI]|nr:hypothetical protein EG329_005952 [Helotiales sp. DMI_Dod_QoI]